PVRVLSRPQKQAILGENNVAGPKITVYCRNPQEPPLKSGRLFLFKSVRCCKKCCNQDKQDAMVHSRGRLSSSASRSVPTQHGYPSPAIYQHPLFCNIFSIKLWILVPNAKERFVKCLR